jgi:TetR/AcrR family transcriptional repressor of mexCD-oprJ operon
VRARNAAGCPPISPTARQLRPPSELTPTVPLDAAEALLE